MAKKTFRKISLLLVLLGLLSITSCSDTSSFDYVASTHIIPAPKQLVTGEGFFTLDKNISFKSIEYFGSENSYFSNYMQQKLGFNFETTNRDDKAQILFKRNNNLVEEGYLLSIDQKITIEANTQKGLFYGIQSLIQLLPFEHLQALKVKSVKFPRVIVKDEPKFKYRGMHLDVSRHFFPVEFIKEYIDHLAMLKMNNFHWHLTDDQGWRIEIKQYPELTNKAANRQETLIGHYNDSPQEFDGKRYGGFYTQEDVKEIVAYASQRHITVIPEIEMPGHTQAAIHAYPELGCTGLQVPVATKWGVFEEVFCPKEETFTFLKNVLDEVAALFPSEYIHIGGDEAPKTRWKSCAHCQNLMKDKGLKNEEELQSHFITTIEKHLNSTGKKIIGWDEILEGGLAPNATVMSWRGSNGAIEAAKEGHDVIMTPTSHSYFDYYQATYEDEPTAIGGYLPLKKVFGFNPVPAELNPEEAKHVLGAQGNIWTEYISTSDQLEYMAFPRMLAMAEVVWSGPTKNLEEDYDNFLERLEPFMERMDVLDINYANHLFNLEGAVVKENNEVFYTLSTPTKGKEIRYSVNDKKKLKYVKPFKISALTSLEAAKGIPQYVINGQVYKKGAAVGRKFSDTIDYHKAVNAQVAINVEPHPAYSAGGKEALINGVNGSNTRFGDKEWLGFWGDDLEITITFPEPTKINKISTRFYNANGQWLYAPNNWRAIITLENGSILSNKQMINSDEQIVLSEMKLDTKSYLTKQLVLRIPSYGIIPDGYQGAGNKAWTFIDEVIVE
jgi:hexosaminidase